MGKLKRIVIWSIVIFVVGGLAFQTFRAVSYKEPVRIYSQSKGSVDIKLIAIRHDKESEYYDVYGNKIEPLSLGDMTTPSAINFGASYYTMDFVFEIPEDKEIFFPSPMMNITVDGSHPLWGGSQRYRILDHKGSKLLVVNSMFQKTYGRGSMFGSSSDRYSHIDLQLMYYYDHGKGNQPTGVTIKGPFTEGTIPAPTANRIPVMLFNADVTDDAGVVSANFDTNGTNHGCIIIYDKDSKKHMVSRTTNKGNPWGGNFTCFIDGIKLSEIDSIEFKQNSDSQIFKNIKINPPASEK